MSLPQLQAAALSDSGRRVPSLNARVLARPDGPPGQREPVERLSPGMLVQRVLGVARWVTWTGGQQPPARGPARMENSDRIYNVEFKMGWGVKKRTL